MGRHKKPIEEKKTRTFRTRLTQAEYDRLAALCRGHGWSQSALIRELINDFAERRLGNEV